MKNFLLIVFLLCSCAPVYSFPNPVKKFRSLSLPRATRTLAKQKVLNQAQRRVLLEQKIKFITQLKRAIGTITLPTEDFSISPQWENPRATAFVFQETYNGKKQLWGVSATHYSFKNPALVGPSSNKEEDISFVAQGHSGFNDISLFPIPSDMQAQFIPLPLAKTSAQLGDTVYSAGYFEDKFHIEGNRTVVEKGSHNFVTSLKVEDKLCREGACGGPVLNEQGEVVGVHVGSSQRRQLGFVIPVEHIYELLEALHHDGKFARPFFFKGRAIGTVNINEHITAIETWQGDRLVDNFLTYNKRHSLDYEHLEDVVNFSGADTVRFIIERTPFSMLAKDQRIHRYEIIYNLKNFHISKRERK